MSEDTFDLARRRQVETAQAIDVSAAAAHQKPEILHLGRFIEMSVEVLVGQFESLQVIGFHEGLLLRQDALEPCDQSWVRAHGQVAHDLEFERTPQEMSLVSERQVDGADQCRMLWKHVHKAFLLESHQGIANRRGAYAELRRKRCARQGSTGRELQGQNGFPQALENLRSCLTATLQSLCWHGDLLLQC